MGDPLTHLARVTILPSIDGSMWQMTYGRLVLGIVRSFYGRSLASKESMSGCASPISAGRDRDFSRIVSRLWSFRQRPLAREAYIYLCQLVHLVGAKSECRENLTTMSTATKDGKS
jgi:hypothetical protein